MTACYRLHGEIGLTYIIDVTNVMVYLETVIVVSDFSGRQELPAKSISYFSLWEEKPSE